MLGEPETFHRERTANATYAVFQFHCPDLPITGKERIIHLAPIEQQLADTAIALARPYLQNEQYGTLDNTYIGFTLVKVLEVLLYRIMGAVSAEHPLDRKSVVIY